MRELTIRIRFTSPCLGNAKDARGGRYRLIRSDLGAVLFLSTWHRANMKFAAQVLGKHQDEVSKIAWDTEVDGETEPDCWSQRFYRVGAVQRFSLHESFKAGQVVGINCVVPATISDDELWRLMQLAGTYKGLSPFRPGESGHFEVVSIRPRRGLPLVKETGPDSDASPNQAQESR